MTDTYVLYLQGDNLFVSSYYDYRVKEDNGCDVEYIRESKDYNYLQTLAITLVVMDCSV